MGWIKAKKRPEHFVSVLLNCPESSENYSYRLGWFDGIAFVNEENKMVKVSEWHKLPNPPIRDNKLVCKKNA